MLRLVPVTLFVALLALPALAQDWQGEARVRGVVLDADGEPLAGARVQLVLHDLEEGPAAVVTEASGEWSFPRLAPGLYDLRIDGPGHLPAEGWVRVPGHGAPEPVRIELQSLDLVTPSFAEGDPAGSVRRWLAFGDALLANDRPSDARREYRKALATPGVLSPAARAELLSGMARTHFLEGDRAAAETALRAALVIAPAGSTEAERARQVFRALLDGGGRGEEAERFFERLRREPGAVEAELADVLAGREPEAEDGSDGNDEAPARPPERPLLDPEPGRTGRYRTAFAADAGSPLSAPETYLERYGMERSVAERGDPDGLGYDLARESFEVYVPDGYEPGAGYGLLVWVSPTPFGGTETPEVQAALDRAKLLWIGANDSGNPRPSWDRSGLALDAAHRMAALYDLDPERVYVAGYSGGGRIASGLALHFPEVFRGAFSVYGVSWYEPVPVPDKPGANWPPSFAAPRAESLRDLRTDSRFVLLTGSRDFNKPQTRAVRRAMEAAGFERVTYLEVPGASHYELPDGEWWGKAFRALDGAAARDLEEPL